MARLPGVSGRPPDARTADRCTFHAPPATSMDPRGRLPGGDRRDVRLCHFPSSPLRGRRQPRGGRPAALAVGIAGRPRDRRRSRARHRCPSRQSSGRAGNPAIVRADARTRTGDPFIPCDGRELHPRAAHLCIRGRSSPRPISARSPIAVEVSRRARVGSVAGEWCGIAGEPSRRGIGPAKIPGSHH